MRLAHTNGVVVNVSDEKASRLLAQGFTRVEEPKKAPAKKSASSKKND